MAGDELNNVVSCIDAIVASYNEASDIIQQVKQERVKRRAPAPPRILEESIQCAPVDIQKEKDRGIARFGDDFDLGDSTALQDLRDTCSQLKNFVLLLQDLRDSNGLADFRNVVDEADARRDETVDALIQLRQRLKHKEEVQTASPEPADDAQPRISLSSPPRSPVPNPPAKTYHMPHRHQWLGMHSRTKTIPQDTAKEPQNVEDDTVAGAENHNQSTHGQKKHGHGSLLHFLKHHRTHSHDKDLPETAIPSVIPPIDEHKPLSRTMSLAPDHNVLGKHPNGSGISLSEKQSQPLPPIPTWLEASQKTDSPRKSGEHRDSQSSVETLTPSIFSTTSRNRANSTATSIMRSQSFVGTTPTPENDYLGFCKGAVRLQNGDKKALEKRKEFNDGWSSSAVFYLACCSHKCAFAGHIDINVIMTKVWVVEDKGLKFRWPFLAKSHVPQIKVKDHAYSYQCLICTYSGQKSPVFHGTDLYLDHVSSHRGETDEVALYKARCIGDHEADDKEEFDLNLFPPSSSSENKAAGNLTENMAALYLKPESDGKNEKIVPWNEGLSDFHYRGDEIM